MELIVNYIDFSVYQYFKLCYHFEINIHIYYLAALLSDPEYPGFCRPVGAVHYLV